MEVFTIFVSFLVIINVPFPMWHFRYLLKEKYKNRKNFHFCKNHILKNIQPIDILY